MHSREVRPASPVFYGYIIVAASFLIGLIVNGMQLTYGVFFSSLQSEFGWDRATISGAHSLLYFLVGIFAVFVGRLTDRFGPRIVMVACGISLGVGYALLSQVHAVWQLYLFYSVIVSIGISGGDVALLSTTARWFVRRRSVMSSIVKIGTGAGIFFMPIIASSLIAGYGWRSAYLVLGFSSAVLVILIAQLLRRDPAQKGLKPYGEQQALARNLPPEGSGLSLRQALHTRQFWAVGIIYLILLYSANSITIHIIPHAIDLGIAAGLSASLLSTIGAVSIPGRLLAGIAGDRVGNRRALVVCLLVLVAALSWLQLARELWSLYLFVTVYGLAHGGFFSLVSPLLAELFGTRSHGVIFGMVLLTSHIGGAIGPLVTGRIFDVTRSYHLAFLILVVIGVIGFALSLTLKPVALKSQEKEEER